VVPENGRKLNIAAILKKAGRRTQGTYSLTSVPWKVMEQPFLETISMHMNDKKVIRSSLYGSTEGKSCLISLLIPFYNEMTGLVDEGRAVDIVYFDFRKAF